MAPSDKRKLSTTVGPRSLTKTTKYVYNSVVTLFNQLAMQDHQTIVFLPYMLKAKTKMNRFSNRALFRMTGKLDGFCVHTFLIRLHSDSTISEANTMQSTSIMEGKLAIQKSTTTTTQEGSVSALVRIFAVLKLFD
jgi:hypothetical protein